MYVFGDPHGHLPCVQALLREAGLVGEDLRWIAGAARFLFVGDYLDNGPDGVGVVDLVMRLQAEARAVGGRVDALLGNHDVLFLAALRLGGRHATTWLEQGGQEEDRAGASQAHIDWLSTLPAMLVHQDHLCVHADTPAYLRYGASAREVNDSVRDVLASDDASRWDELLDDLGQHHAFEGQSGVALARRFLTQFGGSRILHGHTPIQKVTAQPSQEVRGALAYADGLCVNVDGGIYKGGPGFVYRTVS